MYKSIDPTEAIKCLLYFLPKNNIDVGIPINKIKSLLNDCIINCSSFTVDNRYFKQTSGL